MKRFTLCADKAPSLTAIFLALLIFQPWAAASAATQIMTSETKMKLPSGAELAVPAGWFVEGKGKGYVIQDPDRQLTIVVAQSDEVDASDAIHSAWKYYFPDFSLASQVRNMPGRDDWDEYAGAGYWVPDPMDITRPDPNRSVRAVACKKKNTWYVALVDGKKAAIDRRNSQIGLIVFGLIPPGGSPKAANKSGVVLDAAKLKEFEEFIERARNECRVPGAAVALIQNGKVIFEKGFGIRELKKNEPVTPHTLFAIASITKPLTTLLMARLVDRGRVSWDTPLVKLLPGLRLANPFLTQSLTLQYSVCACTGLPRQDMELVFPAKGSTPEEVLGRMQAIAPTTGFGETFQYSNDMVAAGGYAAARAAEPQGFLGDAYDRALKAEVFDPLGMRDSTLSLRDVLVRDHATPHGRTFELEYAPEPFEYEDWMIPIRPAAGAWSSVEDLSQVVLMELSKGMGPDGSRYLSEKNLLKRREPQVRIGSGGAYGLGMILETPDDLMVYGHGGTAMGFSTDMVFLPDQGVGLVVLSNAQDSDLFTHSVRKKLLEFFSGKPPRAQEDLNRSVASWRVESHQMREYAMNQPAQSWIHYYAGDYVNRDLGKVSLLKTPEGPLFDQGRWKVPMDAYYEHNETVKFVLTAPPMAWMTFTLVDHEGHKTLTYDTPQKKYVFEKTP